MTFLLDVNVLIALVDADHVSHQAAHDWFGREGKRSWATCPLTESGLVRIVGNPKYQGGGAAPAQVLRILTGLTELEGHVRWPDDVSLTDPGLFVADRVLTPAQVTDTYLLRLAVRRGGRLATLDRRLSPLAVIGGEEALLVI